MSVDDRLRLMTEMHRDMKSMHDKVVGEGSGNGGGGMDDRIARLEDKFDKLRDDNGRVREHLATLAERIAHLPSKGFVINALLASLAVIAGLVTFGEKLQALVK